MSRHVGKSVVRRFGEVVRGGWYRVARFGVPGGGCRTPGGAGNGRKLGATGGNGRQRETMEATGDNGIQREEWETAKGTQRQREATSKG